MKNYDKLVKQLGKELIGDLDSLSPEALKEKIVLASDTIKKAKEELEENLDYQSLKEKLSDLSQGMKEVKKRQKAIIEYCLNRLEG